MESEGGSRTGAFDRWLNRHADTSCLCHGAAPYAGPKSNQKINRTHRMAKPLIFEFKGAQIPLQMSKVDRAKLYGFKDLEILDEEGDKCELATLAEDGRTVVGKGGTGIGYLTADGNWCDKTVLTPVDLEGRAMTPVASSFSAPIELDRRATLDELLDHSMRLVYRMDFEEGGGDQLMDELKSGAIFRFDYSFRGGLEPDTGFLLTNEMDEVFLLIGTPSNIEMIGHQQPRFTAEMDEDASEDELMDFGMI